MAAPTPKRRLPRGRHEHILRELELRGSLRAAVTAAELGVTEVTIRRDLIDLEKLGKLARVHGGAISVAAPETPRPGKSLVGLILPTGASHYPDVVRGAESASPGLRARVVLASSNYSLETEQRHLDRLAGLGVDGIILAPTLRDRTLDELARALQRVPVPIVLLERRLETSTALARFDWVRTDHARGTELAVEHLVGLGHDSVALALLDRTPTAPSIREGYGRSSASLGLRPAPIRSLPKSEVDADAAAAALAEFLDDCLAQDVRAAIVHTDFHAAHLLEIAIDRGIRVPEDFSIVAYDDENAQLAIVPLTAVAPPGRELGRLAMTTLYERIHADDPAELSPRHISLVPRLNVRRSSAAPPV
jgi:DNA-binding LacI/PurR family transcriptional regulator